MMEVFTSPDAIFLLMTLGLYGLIYEFVSPGVFLPGIAGAICLLLAALAINQVPVNYFGILLMILGIGCMTTGAFVRSYGILALAGAIGFAVGGRIFIDSSLPGTGVSPWLIGSMTLISLGVLSVGLKMLLRTRKKQISTGVEGLLHSVGEITEWSGAKGEVMIAGTVWKARSSADGIFKKGDRVKVSEIDGLCLIIQPLN
ncbi:MAG: NfeD family protein [Pseudomonadota bacterium]